MSVKKQYARANQASFMNTELHTAIMVISQLRNKFLKCQSERVKRHRKNKGISALRHRRNNGISALSHCKKQRNKGICALSYCEKRKE